MIDRLRLNLEHIYPPFGDAPSGAELLFEAWERMTYGGVHVGPCPIIPFNWTYNVGGQWVSYSIR